MVHYCLGKSHVSGTFLYFVKLCPRGSFQNTLSSEHLWTAASKSYHFIYDTVWKYLRLNLEIFWLTSVSCPAVDPPLHCSLLFPNKTYLLQSHLSIFFKKGNAKSDRLYRLTEVQLHFLVKTLHKNNLKIFFPNHKLHLSSNIEQIK